MSLRISGATRVAGVVGAPVTHSISPILHNAWIAAAALDAVYVAFAPTTEAFPSFVAGMRGGAVKGLNVTAPFKEQALAASDTASSRAVEAGAANVLVFEADGRIVADNTDGVGLLSAFAEQAPSFAAGRGPVVLVGAGGAARGAATALLAAGAPEIRIVNRSAERAQALAGLLGPRSVCFDWSDASRAFDGASAIINATPAGRDGDAGLALPLGEASADAVVMDMTYRPLITPWLRQAQARGLAIVDGLAMLIGQAAPSFEAFFGVAPPAIDIRAAALDFLEGRG